MSADAALLEVTPRRRVGEHFRDIWRYRELLVGMVRKELKVKYKNSVLGFVWSLLNPLLYLVVFYIVFQVILGSGIPSFPIFLLSGLLVWNLFSAGFAAATRLDRRQRGRWSRRCAFPREILPLAAVGARSCTSSCSASCCSRCSRSCAGPLRVGVRLAARAWRWSRCCCSRPRSASCSARSTSTSATRSTSSSSRCSRGSG